MSLNVSCRRRVLFAAAPLLVLAACGGGSDSPAPAPAPTPAPPPVIAPAPTCTSSTDQFSVVADSSLVVGRVGGVVIAGCTGALSNVVWTQTGGPAVQLMSAKTQAISFEPTAAGAHMFSVAFTDAQSIPRTASVTINVTAPSATVAVVARGDQAVRSGGNVSIRAWPPLGSLQTNRWTQIAGPAVTLNTTDPNVLLFTAPSVSRDTALVFRVTRTTGTVETGLAEASDDVMVLVENHAQAPTDPTGTGPYVFSDSHVSRVYPYKATGPYAGVLTSCVYNAQLQYIGAGANLCTLTTLPFLHQTTSGNVPTVAQIMDRVLVSHDWMGQVFENFLTTQASQDVLRLFNGVTAIVIGAHVRPSFYYALTGAIYLDADYLWLTPEQRDVIDEAPDFRSDFDRDLQYSGLWRYTLNNANIFLPFPATSRIPRDITYLVAETGWLLYHELGHASDFLPVSVRGMLNPGLSAWANISPRYQAQQLPSDQLAANLPLQSSQMFGLAEVKFQGATATQTERAYTPTQVGGFFSGDRATDEYNYSTTREDIAMVFEEFMMYRNHGYRRDVAITDKITSTTTSNTLIVRWGQRGRVGEASVKPRAELAVSQLAPWVNIAEVTALPAPIAMRAGDSWAGNLVLPAAPSGMLGALSAGSSLSLEHDRLLLRRALTRQLMGIDAGARAHAAPNERWIRNQPR